jgi:dimethylaniline monooxygenase (N-oxide forming)
MERSAKRVQAWKREHGLSEPSRAYGISTRFHQYLDTILSDLGLNPYRKKNRLLEVVDAYTANDYRDVADEYVRSRQTRPAPYRPVPVDT